MAYAQLNADGTFGHEITETGNIEWDATHFCPVSALTLEEAALFRVVPLVETPPPVASDYQTVTRDGGEFVAGSWQYKWLVLDFTPAEIDAARGANRAALAARIDAAVMAIYDKPMLLSEEYKQREAAAQAYKDAGYSGTVPARVAGFATPAGVTAQAGADLILSQAAQLHGALGSLSDLRMQKYVVTRKDPATGAFVASDADAQASADSTLAQIATIAKALA